MAAHQNGVRRLLGDEALAGPALGHPLGLDDFVGGEGGAAEVADLAGPHQVGQRSQGLVDIGLGRGAVDLIEVDVVDAEPAQAVVARGHDPAPRVPLRVGVLAHLAVHLRGEDHPVPLGLRQRLPDDLLGLAERVDVGGVDEVDAGVEGGVDDADGVVVVGVAEGPEHHRPEAEWADFEAGSSECAVFHPVESSHGPVDAGRGRRRQRRRQASAAANRSAASPDRPKLRSAASASLMACSSPEATAPSTMASVDGGASVGAGASRSMS